ncbi:cohesin domain-containing protein [Paenibacillus aceris]|uniref:Dockerin domain-containing protein n=1 Tax=Paenibacillus aceris TaxID=869555 RepID=A0ABS4I2C8_9BACL|nr:cohesin domain-containing protein [Paenibacillus aceris]MBP1965072.1 hypothetical protein [Paenibacillus aceris]NHW33055.1 hypothetical protein [Paenibacillus aceris]
MSMSQTETAINPNKLEKAEMLSFLGKTLYYVILAIITLIIFVPLLVVVFAAFKTSPELAATSPFSLPKSWSLHNFAVAFEKANMLVGFVNSLSMADITVAFDADTIDFVSVDPLISGFTEVQTQTDVPGQIRIIAVSQGNTGVVTASGDVFKFNWIAKPNHPSTTTNLVLTKVAVSNGLGQKLDATPANLTVSITAIDKTLLQTVIGLAQSIYDHAVEGTHFGQYAAGSKAVLLSAIQAATAIYSDPAATQQHLEDSAIALNQALQAFSGQIITVYAPGDVNGDNAIDIGDLGKAAVHYGKTAASSDWNEAKSADINHDNKISIVDIVSIAKLILQ